MGGTKIIVLQLRDIIKTAIFALAGIGLVILLIYLFVPNRQNSNDEASVLYTPGTYSSEIILHSKPVLVDVKVTDKEIVDITLTNMNENQQVFYPLFNPVLGKLSAQIIKSQTADVGISQDSPETSKILLEAVDIALSKAESAEMTASTNGN